MTRTIIRLAIILLLALTIGHVRAQNEQGAATPNDPGHVGSMGQGESFPPGSGGPPPTPCSNQFVLNYSNSCALIAKPWGQ